MKSVQTINKDDPNWINFFSINSFPMVMKLNFNTFQYIQLENNGAIVFAHECHEVTIHSQCDKHVDFLWTEE